MNYFGSRRRLFENSQSALLSAVEIYNKPKISYREESFVILLVNSWELLFKAILSKNKKRIFYPKRRGEPYRTLSLTDSLRILEPIFPSHLPFLPIKKNVELLEIYRDAAIHFYNETDFQNIIFILAQTSIVNFRDVAINFFGKEVAQEITWAVLPLGSNHPVDPVAFLSGKKGKQSVFVGEYMKLLQDSIREVEGSNLDTGRLLTIFNIKLESTKKITLADLVVGVRSPSGGEPLVIQKKVDPNESHPWREKDVIPNFPQLQGKKMSKHVFRAIVSKYDLKNNPNLVWVASEGILTKYSKDIIPWVTRLSENEIIQAVRDYNNRSKSKSQIRLKQSEKENGSGTFFR